MSNTHLDIEFRMSDLKLRVHLKTIKTENALSGWNLRLYRHLRDFSVEDGFVFETVKRSAAIKAGTRSVAQDAFEDGFLNIIDDRSVCHPAVLNAGVAYIGAFWHLDPNGVKALSSIGHREFDPTAFSAKRVATFFEGLQNRYVRKRNSKYGQREEHVDVPKNAISLFFQGMAPLSTGVSKFEDFDILELLLNQTSGVPIVVKPHPLVTQKHEIDFLHDLAKQDNRLFVTDANVHDILQNSAVTISNNSTVALEGFFHKKPAILFGDSDFHHIAHRFHTGDNVLDLIGKAKNSRPAYPEFLAWYFLDQCLHLNSKKLKEKVYAIFRQHGFDTP